MFQLFFILFQVYTNAIQSTVIWTCFVKSFNIYNTSSLEDNTVVR